MSSLNSICGEFKEPKAVQSQKKETQNKKKQEKDSLLPLINQVIDLFPDLGIEIPPTYLQPKIFTVEIFI